MAAARFVATAVVLRGAEPDQNWKFVPVFEPSVPPARVAAVQAKALEVSASVMLFPPVPSVAAVRVTVLPLAPAVTPTVAGVGQALIAAARLEAKPEVVESTANVPVVLVGQVFVPLLPAVTAPQEKIPVLFDAPTERVELPSVVLVTVTVLVLDVAVTPAAAGHRPIAVLRLVARVVVLELLA